MSVLAMIASVVLMLFCLVWLCSAWDTGPGDY